MIRHESIGSSRENNGIRMFQRVPEAKTLGECRAGGRCVTRAGQEHSDLVPRAQRIFFRRCVFVCVCVLGRSRLDWDLGIWGGVKPPGAVSDSYL